MRVSAKVCKHFEFFVVYHKARDTFSPPHLPGKKGKGLPQHAEVAQGVPRRLRSRIFLTFGTRRVVGRQHYAPAAFTPVENPRPHF